MKKILTSILAIGGVALLILASCKKNDAIVVNSGSKSSALTASVTTLLLDRSLLADTTSVVMFNFTAPSYNYKAVVSNVLQIDPDGDNWKNPASAALGKSGAQGFNTADFNALLLKLNVSTDAPSKVNIRVANELSNVVANYSNVVTLTVQPFKLAAFIYAAGAFEGWSVPSANVATLESATANNIYIGLINFPAGAGNQDFKILPDQNDYNGNYGAGATPGTITQGNGNPPNITAPAALYYQVTVDLNQNTISFVNTWSLIGDASPGGWSTDTDMSYDATTKTWFTTVTLVGDGSKAIKFRYLHDWGVNLGGSGGTLTAGGANIVIPTTPAGGASYKVTLDPVADTYTLVKQ
jgi:hypothetical protein